MRATPAEPLCLPGTVFLEWDGASKSVAARSIPDAIPTVAESISDTLVLVDYPYGMQRDRSYREGEPFTLPHLPITRQQVILVTGLAITVAAVHGFQTTAPTPVFAGSFQMAAVPQASLNPVVGIPQIQTPNQTIAPIDYATQIQVLESPRIIDPIVARLQAQGWQIDAETLTDRLEITSQAESHQLTITYHDSDRQRVQAVLEQVAQAFVKEGEACQSGTCRGIEFVAAQIPVLEQRIAFMQQELKTFEQRYGITNLEQQTQQLLLYRAQVEQQVALAEVSKQEGLARLRTLQHQLELPEGDSIAFHVLQGDAQYRSLLNQLLLVERRMATALSYQTAEGDRSHTLKQRYQTLLVQLRQQAQETMAKQYAGDRRTQMPTHANLMRQWIDSAYFLTVLDIRQQTLSFAQQHLNQKVQQWAAITRYHTERQQAVQHAIDTLNQYLSERDRLESEPFQEVAWQVVDPPEVMQQMRSVQ